MFTQNIGVRVFGSEEKACLVVDYETEAAVMLPGREYETAAALAETINRLLAEGDRRTAEEYKNAFQWLQAHTNELKEPSNRRDVSVFEPADVSLLVARTIQDYKHSKRLTKFEKAAIRRALETLSPLEQRVFIIAKVWGVKTTDLARLFGISDGSIFKMLNRIKRKLEKTRKTEKTPARYR